jgi:membrane protease YdiL (CAAX protease family)
MLWVSAGLMVVLQLPLAGWAIPGERLAAQVEREGVYWALTALLVIYIARMERRPLSSVGLRAPTWKSFAFGVVGGLVMLAGIIALYTWVMPQLGSTSSAKQLSTVRALPLWFRIGIVVRAAIFEELFYRGFMIERLTELTGLRWVAAILSIAAFTYAHVGFWGWGHLLIAGFGG